MNKEDGFIILTMEDIILAGDEFRLSLNSPFIPYISSIGIPVRQLSTFPGDVRRPIKLKTP